MNLEVQSDSRSVCISDKAVARQRAILLGSELSGGEWNGNSGGGAIHEEGISL